MQRRHRPSASRKAAPVSGSQRISATVVRRKALEKGMITLRQDGYRKVLNGITTIDEVVTATIGDYS